MMKNVMTDGPENSLMTIDWHFEMLEDSVSDLSPQLGVAIGSDSPILILLRCGWLDGSLGQRL